jgi:hypothetical protein
MSLILNEKYRPDTTYTEKRINIRKNWELKFINNEKSCDLPVLVSWTKINDMTNYSGEVVYTKKVHLNSAKTVILEFEESKPLVEKRIHPDRQNKGNIAFIDTPVKDAAIIYVNKKEVGALWCPPYKLDISNEIIEGENIIEIRVFNRLLNYLSAKPSPNFSELNEQFGTRFDKIQDYDDIKPVDSGLTGNVFLSCS